MKPSLSLKIAALLGYVLLCTLILVAAQQGDAFSERCDAARLEAGALGVSSAP